jgi:hypothetical protein
MSGKKLDRFCVVLQLMACNKNLIRKPSFAFSSNEAASIWFFSICSIVSQHRNSRHDTNVFTRLLSKKKIHSLQIILTLKEEAQASTYSDEDSGKASGATDRVEDENERNPSMKSTTPMRRLSRSSEFGVESISKSSRSYCFFFF